MTISFLSLIHEEGTHSILIFGDTTVLQPIYDAIRQNGAGSKPINCNHWVHDYDRISGHSCQH